MRKYWILFLTVCSVSTFFFNEASASIKEYELTDHPTLTFEGPFSSYQITLKGTKYTHYTPDSKSINISYIIKVNTPISECVVNLSLQDKDGFEIVKKIISPVVKGYTGSLKGNFSLEPNQYQRISGAELFFSVYPK